MTPFSYIIFNMKKVKYKYDEDKALSELKKYIDSTYDEHYSKNKFQATEYQSLTAPPNGVHNANLAFIRR